MSFIIFLILRLRLKEMKGKLTDFFNLETRLRLEMMIWIPLVYHRPSLLTWEHRAWCREDSQALRLADQGGWGYDAEQWVSTLSNPMSCFYS